MFRIEYINNYRTMCEQNCLNNIVQECIIWHVPKFSVKLLLTTGLIVISTPVCKMKWKLQRCVCMCVQIWNVTETWCELDVAQSLTEIAKQRMTEDGVETYGRVYYPGGVPLLKRTPSW